MISNYQILSPEIEAERRLEEEKEENAPLTTPVVIEGLHRLIHQETIGE
jgi:hypothetical protein